MSPVNGTSFGYVFKKYRLRSHIASLEEFGNLLVERGIVYEQSLFSKWQRNERCPKDRRVLLNIIAVFAQREGVTTIKQANEILAAVAQPPLTLCEREQILRVFSQLFHPIPPNMFPFIGRTAILKEIIWRIINSGHVAITGVSGIGKTALATYIAHLYQRHFSHSVYWFCMEDTTIERVIDEILSHRNVNIFTLRSFRQKMEVLRDCLEDTHTLIVLDNFTDCHNSTVREFLNTWHQPVLITSQNCALASDTTNSIPLEPFTPEEYEQLAEEILGNTLVKDHYEEIMHLGKELNYLPSAVVAMLSDIAEHPEKLFNSIHEPLQR